MTLRIPNTASKVEVRQAFQHLVAGTSFLLDGDTGEILIGAGNNVQPIWSTELTALTLLTVDNITINGASITSDTGTVGFGDDNLSTAGAISGVNVTSGESPGHTHDNRYYTETELNAGQLDNRYYTEDEIDVLLEDTVLSYTAETDSDVVAGQPVYTKANTHVDLARANSGSEYMVSGVAIEAASSGESVEYTSDGKVTLDDWTDIIGSETLTSGLIYYLAEVTGGGVGSPLYTNTGGTGNRTSIITVTTNTPGALYVGNWSTLVDGAYANQLYWREQAAAGIYVRFDFGVGISKLITEAKWYQSILSSHGVWRWQGSDDAVDWTNIGNTFTLQGAAQTLTELNANTIGYRYYQLLGVSGTISLAPYLQEIEFKITNYVLSTAGMLTTTPPSTVGSYIVQVGRAISTTTLDVEIGPIILL